MEEFKKDLEELLNIHCIDNECNMPDFLLAEMLVNIIKAISDPVKETITWHDHHSCQQENKQQTDIKPTELY